MTEPKIETQEITWRWGPGATVRHAFHGPYAVAVCGRAVSLADWARHDHGDQCKRCLRMLAEIQELREDPR